MCVQCAHTHTLCIAFTSNRKKGLEKHLLKHIHLFGGDLHFKYTVNLAGNHTVS